MGVGNVGDIRNDEDLVWRVEVQPVYGKEKV
jgi:hypothetical protein